MAFKPFDLAKPDWLNVKYDLNPGLEALYASKKTLHNPAKIRVPIPGELVQVSKSGLLFEGVIQCRLYVGMDATVYYCEGVISSPYHFVSTGPCTPWTFLWPFDKSLLKWLQHPEEIIPIDQVQEQKYLQRMTSRIASDYFKD